MTDEAMSGSPGFPTVRGRRLRRTEALRRLVRETRVSAEQLVLPLFICPGQGVREPVPSMTGVSRTSVDEAIRDVLEAVAVGVGAVLLFGIPASKDESGSGAWAEDGVVQSAVAALRAEFPELTIITDVCLCEYTSHGHCGVLLDGVVQNDVTLELLARTAVSHARVGADIVAPSDMMDGRVGAIRRSLDDAELGHVAIMSYSAKFASAFYGPFRDAAGSAPREGDRRAYQMDPANAELALREVRLDVAEGADIVMVKPALPYLDLVRRVRDEVGVPVAAYQVSGEYAAIMAAAERGWLDGPAALEESLLSMARAGADVLITYWAREFARRLAPRD
jgi:porphobilinogen synthase